MIVEICANSLRSSLIAEEAGADRIELCAELELGGITPSYGQLKAIREAVQIPIHVLIRPRSGNFTYSNEEFSIMKTDIDLCANLGYDGIVSGILHVDNTLDLDRTKELVDRKKNLHFTFHRAFDWISHPLDSAKQLETMGVDYILSSGQQKSAEEGINLLSNLEKELSTCKIIPGGGIGVKNAALFKKHGFTAIHLSATQLEQTLDEQPRISMRSTTAIPDHKIAVSNKNIIERVLKIVK